MHERWKEITGNSRWQLLDTRADRYRKVWEDLEELLDEDHEPMLVWLVMVRCLWSDPWRREAKSHHDPANVYRSPAQRENWILEALEEIARGGDGSGWGDARRGNGAGRPMEDARTEEAGIVAARLQAAGRVNRDEEAREMREDRARRRHLARLREWFEAQDPVGQGRVREKAARNVRELWPLPNRDPPAGIVAAAKVKALEQESGITLDEEEQDG